MSPSAFGESSLSSLPSKAFSCLQGGWCDELVAGEVPVALVVDGAGVNPETDIGRREQAPAATAKSGYG